MTGDFERSRDAALEAFTRARALAVRPYRAPDGARRRQAAPAADTERIPARGRAGIQNR